MKATVGIGLVGVVVLAFPSAAWAPPPGPPAHPGHVTVVRTPAGGPPGTQISLSGTCAGGDDGTGSTVYVDLYTKDGDVGDFGNGSFPVAPDGTWRGSITVAPGSGQRDLNLNVSCARTGTVVPFYVTDRNTTARPTIVTNIGRTPCGAPGGLPPGVGMPFTCQADIKSFTSDGALAATNFFADGAGGGNVAVGDVDGSGDPEIIVGTASDEPCIVAVYSLAGDLITKFNAYDPAFLGGVNVAVADLDGDGKAEIITGAGPGGGPNVRVFNGAGEQEASFFAYDAGFIGGVNVAARSGEIVTGPGPGGGPHVRRFAPNGRPIGDGFFAYDPAFAGGVRVATGANRIVTGPGPGGGPEVRVYSLAGLLRSSFFAYDPKCSGGVSVALGDNDIITGAGGASHVRTFSFTGDSLGPGFFAYEQRFEAGVSVAAVPST